MIKLDYYICIKCDIIEQHPYSPKGLDVVCGDCGTMLSWWGISEGDFTHMIKRRTCAYCGGEDNTKCVCDDIF
jgi:hypothetical protein